MNPSPNQRFGQVSPGLFGALGACAAGAALLGQPREAFAFTIDSTVTSGCHEDITTDAMRIVRAKVPEAGRVAPVGDERFLADSVPFSIADDMRDTGSLALLIANRDVDLEGGRATDATRLAQVHSNPGTQASHCLRGFDDDEPVGAGQAIAACRRRIREKALEAASHAGADGRLDPAERVLHRTDIAYRGPVEVTLPPQLVALGEALHAVQDGFAHAYRTADGLRIVTVLNFVDPQAGDEAPERNGPPHLAALDRCDNPDELRALKRRIATEASAELAGIVLDPANAGDRERQVDLFLDKYFTLEPGCTVENAWCGAPEAALKDESECGCTVPGRRAVRWPFAPLLGVALALGAVARRRGARLGGAVLGAVCFASISTMSPRLAFAEDPPPPPPAAPPDRDPKVPTSTAGENTKGRIGVYLFGSGSQDNPAAAVGAGLRYNVGAGFLVGPDIEWNPWFSLEREESKAGTMNLYLTGVRRWHVGSRWIHLRTTAKAGVSRMLFDLYGAPSGTTGPFVGFSLLGLELNIWRGLAVVLEPSEIAIPIPQTTGTPLIYTQYRFTIGVQWGAVPLPSISLVTPASSRA